MFGWYMKRKIMNGNALMIESPLRLKYSARENCEVGGYGTTSEFAAN